MKRLTYRTDNGEYTGMPNSIEIRTALEKLSKIEDIEEELGIDLTTLFKALKNGIYFQDDSNSIVIFNHKNIVKRELMLYQLDLSQRKDIT